MVRLERDVERLVRENQKLVHFQVNRYLQRYFVGDMEREDLVSWGLIGLVQAARAWDPERSGCFSTLACRAIERMIIRGVRREWKPERATATISLDDLIEASSGSPMVLLRARALLAGLLDAAPPPRRSSITWRLRRAEELASGNFPQIWASYGRR